MDVATFVEQTLNGLDAIPRIVDSMVATEGPIVNGYGVETHCKIGGLAGCQPSFSRVSVPATG